jgi:dihydrofolate reductase
VLTRDEQWQADNVTAVQSPEQALLVAKKLNSEQVFVIGGAEIYALFLPLASQLELTIVDDAPSADAFFPEYEDDYFIETGRVKNVHDDLSFDYVSLFKPSK